MDKISIIVPIYNEERYIKGCIESILNSSYPKEDIEILLVDGISSDKTREIIKEFQNRYSFIKLLDNSKKFAPNGMNIGIKNSTGEYIFILSAHANYEKDYFLKLVKNIKELNADCVGGVLQTDVKSKNSLSNSIKKVLMHPLGVGNASFRVGVKDIKEVDTVAFGCYNKKSFEKFGLFDERLIRNQDIELNKRVVNSGGKIYLIPDVKAVYYARENFKDLAKNNFSNGYWNILTAFYTKTLNSLSLRHFIPLFFLLSLIIPIFLSIFYPNFIWLSFLSLFSYLSLIILISLKLKDGDSSFLYLILSFLVLHLSYGFGSLVGIFSLICKKFIRNKS